MDAFVFQRALRGDASLCYYYTHHYIVSYTPSNILRYLFAGGSWFGIGFRWWSTGVVCHVDQFRMRPKGCVGGFERSVQSTDCVVFEVPLCFDGPSYVLNVYL